MSTKELLLALLIIVALNQLAELAHACEITPADWAEVEEGINNAN
jgi:hypothetical protein